jgi:hypothetical protein
MNFERSYSTSVDRWKQSVSSEEFVFYERLFLAADSQRSGRIEGAKAVSFFGQTGLPVTILKQIWVLSDVNQQRYLTRNEFYVFLRLVALAQSQQDVSDSNILERTATLTIPPPSFPGKINGVYNSMI